MMQIRAGNTDVCLEMRVRIWEFMKFDFGTEFHEGPHYTGRRWAERTFFLGPWVLAITRLIT